MFCFHEWHADTQLTCLHCIKCGHVEFYPKEDEEFIRRESPTSSMMDNRMVEDNKENDGKGFAITLTRIAYFLVGLLIGNVIDIWLLT